MKGGVLRTALQEAPPLPQNFWLRKISSFGDEQRLELVRFASDGTDLTNASSHGQKAYDLAASTQAYSLPRQVSE